MAYSAKYASAFYGPVPRGRRLRAGGAATAAATSSIPPTPLEGVREAELDAAEGADVIMVKPALPYLDVIRRVKERDAAAGRGLQRQRRVRDGQGRGRRRACSTSAPPCWRRSTGIRRAGADIVISYHAKDVGAWLT